MGCSSLGEYTSSPYTPDAAPNLCTVTKFQCENNSTKLFSSPRQDRDYAKQTSVIRKEAAYHPRRRPKDSEPKVESKKPDGSDSSHRSTESSSYTALHGRNPIKSDRPVKALSGKIKQFQNNECLPEPAFEVTLSDIPKLQSARSNNLLDRQKQAWGPLGSAEGDKLSQKPPGKTVSALVTKEGEESLKKSFPTRLLSSSSDPGVSQVRLGFFTETPISSATGLPQPPKRVSTPAAVPPTNHYGNKGKQNVPEDCKSETKENASDSELEEKAEKKKKKKRNRKKTKPNSETENFPNKSIVYQEPPRIEDDEEFPNLTMAADKKYKSGTPKSFCSTPVTGKQTQVTTTKESEGELHDGSFQNEKAAPKSEVISGRKAGKQASLGSVEKRKTQETSKSSGKKSQIPVQLDLGDMLAALEQKQQAEKSKQSSKPVVLSVGGAVTLPSKESMTATKNQQLNQGNSPHNPLDSSAPLVKKGKQREVPKAKKPTSLKKIILKEREQRKQQHLLEQMAIPKDSDDAVQDPESIAESQAHSEDTKAESTEEKSIDPVNLAQGGSQIDLKSTEFSGSTENALVPENLNANLKIHSRRFRDYCTQVLSKEVDSCVTDLLKELVRFQDRLYQKDPVKAKTKRRLVMGLREVLKHLKLKKLKCVIISPNCEKIQSKGGLDETLHLIIDSACEQNIPFVFALNRKALGRCLNKAVPVSVVGIFSYDGAQDYFHKMVELTMEARQAYKDMISALGRESVEEESGNDCTQSKTPCSESSLLDTAGVPIPGAEEDVPDYIKIWRQKLEEEYKPYMLELEKQLTTKVLPTGFEEPQ